jgi:integrase
MPRKNPSYRHHRASGQAFVELGGRRIYLGKHGTPESWEKYHRLLAEWVATKRVARHADAPPQFTVNDMVIGFLDYAERRYVKNGQQTSEVRSYKTALSPVRRLYGRTPLDAFGPRALVACRQSLIEKGFCRKRINQHVGRIRRAFKWAVAQEMIKAEVWHALAAVDGLRKGEAPDRDPIPPATEAQIAAVMPYLTPPVRALVELQLWTGCRPGEACAIRGCDLTMGDDVWEYRPESHKREHHGLERFILLGPHAKEVIRPWLRANLNAPLFSPRSGRRAYFDGLTRATPKTPSRRARQPAKNPKRAPGERYTKLSYGQAIAKAARRADREAEKRGEDFRVGKLRPNQFRKAAATRIRAAYGIEMARIILGHQSAVTTEIYAAADKEKAIEVMRKLG